jgi:enterochelin esterase-like enzyme
MPDWLRDLDIASPDFLAIVYGLLIACVLVLLVRRPSRRRMVPVVAAGAVGVGLGYLACWWTGDVQNWFGITLTPITRMWVAFAFGAVAIAFVNLWRSRWWRKAVALACIPLAVIAAGAGINVDFGMYSTLGQAAGDTGYHLGALAHETGITGEGDRAVVDPADWAPPAGMPLRGEVFTKKIPGTVSHFAARAADIYLPPAALVPHPPVLPVLIMMSGQPGNPSNMFESGHVNRLLDAFAREHHGLAPIVVSPDQLGEPQANPMCVDSPLGDSATYITVDVVNWIKAHLQVGTSPAEWGVGGFSQGATCSVQFLAGYPRLFGSAIAVSSELEPTIGTSTVATAFGGSAAAYKAATPLSLFSANAPFHHDLIVFGVGQRDAKYRAFATPLEEAAAHAGMSTRLIVSPGTAHDWNTVRYCLKRGMPAILAHLGLDR